MEPRFEQFITEKKFLANVSPTTVEWYLASLKWLPSPSPNGAELKDMVMRMRNAGWKASSCNCVSRAVNSYLHWASGQTGKCHAACPHLKVPKLKEEQRILPTFPVENIQKITKWKPKGFWPVRLAV